MFAWSPRVRVPHSIRKLCAYKIYNKYNNEKSAYISQFSSMRTAGYS